MDETRVEVRPADRNDARWVSALLEQSWGSTEILASGRVLRADLLPALVAEADGNPVGLLTYQISGRELEVVTLDARCRGRGVGTALVGAASEVARSRVCRRVWLVTTNDNLDAVRFYQRRGFRLVTVRVDAVSLARQRKPSIPEVGAYGIPIRDEWGFELVLDSSG